MDFILRGTRWFCQFIGVKCCGREESGREESFDMITLCVTISFNFSENFVPDITKGESPEREEL